MPSYLVDAGYLREQRLADFLSESKANSVAMSEFTCMESYQGDAIANLERSTRILRRFPRQVVVLRGAMELVGSQDKTGAALARADLIDADQTAHFHEFCRGTEAAHADDAFYRKQILAHGDAAAKQLKVVLDSAHLVGEGIRQMMAEIDGDRLKRIRKEEPFTREDADWFVRQVLTMAALVFKSHPSASRWPDAEALKGHWILRYAAAGCVLMQRWIRDGGVNSVPPKKLANDVVDTSISVFGTYFDGVLTLDKKLEDLHEELRVVLEFAFGIAVGE